MSGSAAKMGFNATWAMAALGDLGQLVEAASLVFLFTFAVVNVLAARYTSGPSWIGWAGAIGATVAALALVVRLAFHEPTALAILMLLLVAAAVGRPLLRKKLGAR